MGKKKLRKPSSSSSDDTSDEETPRKLKKHQKKKKSKKRRHASSSSDSSSSPSSSDSEAPKKKSKKKKKTIEKSSDIPLELMAKSKAMAPMTKEEWEKKQSVVRKVYDESTGRHRLIKGDGEVIEEIVSRDRHKEINQRATRGDGEFFQAQMSGRLKK